MQKTIPKSKSGLDTECKRRKAMLKVLCKCEISYDPSRGLCYTWKGKACSGRNADETKHHGRVRWNGRLYYPHRLVYMASKGYIPRGYDVHHTCMNPKCCNPDHMELIKHDDHVKLHNKIRKMEELGLEI